MVASLYGRKFRRFYKGRFILDSASGGIDPLKKEIPGI
jgi:hypothetical protein